MFKDIRKIVLWLFIVMIISFSISIALFRDSGVNFRNFIDSDNNFSRFNGGNDISVRLRDTINDQKYFDMEAIDEIDMGTASADIRFIPEDRDDIKAHFYGNISSSNKIVLSHMASEIKNRTLSIKIIYNKNISIGFGSHNLNLDIYLPKEYSKNIAARSASGDIILESLNIENLSLRSVSGGVKSKSVYAKKSVLESTSGNIKVEDYRGDLSAKTVSGDLYLNTSSPFEDIYIRSISGDVRISLPSNAEFYLESKTTSGKIICDFPISISGRLSDKNINGSVGNGDNKVTTSTVSGDIRISKNN